MALSEALRSKNCSLERLELRENNLGCRIGIKHICSAVATGRLVGLELRSNELTGARCVAEMLKTCLLQELILMDNGLNNLDTKRIVEGLLLGAAKLRLLDLSYNKIGNIGAVALGRVLKSRIGLKLKLYDNRVKSVGIERIDHGMRFGRSWYIGVDEDD
eukprot:CAMPEP_0118723612 /NCGR_PEP_ID=MMETSP0800-20121206/32100_1 /TAXON_ID=210618 ORGANISM="Striatella unipunctata, Strain CCMP2910" /NCGR_SAMPLE_ID=MMETSP0800 /ASSEMBLY_ACC=CAM_ASM_000638 /LENGTH=159 /DNA_ID=CAMNT_0006632057 /DNA_START=107 /DNA_END=586 /DNA_ORIENTATION=-